DVAARSRVAVLGAAARDRLFGVGARAVGREVLLRSQTFRIVGVAVIPDDDQAEMAFVPYTALQDVLGIGYLHTVTVAARQAGEASRVGDDITALLRQRHRAHIEAANRLRQGGLLGNQMPQNGVAGLLPDDFTVRSQAAEALTKGLYTSVAALVIANMPKLDE